MLSQVKKFGSVGFWTLKGHEPSKRLVHSDTIYSLICSSITMRVMSLTAQNRNFIGWQLIFVGITFNVIHFMHDFVPIMLVQYSFVGLQSIRSQIDGA